MQHVVRDLMESVSVYGGPTVCEALFRVQKNVAWTTQTKIPTNLEGQRCWACSLNTVVPGSLAELSLIRHLKEYRSEPCPYLAEGVPGGGDSATTAPRLHGLEGKRRWLCSWTYLQSDLGLPHLSEWRVGLDPIGRQDPLRMFRWNSRCQCCHHWDTHTESPVTQACVSVGHRGSITTQRKLQFCEKWAHVFFQHVKIS